MSKETLVDLVKLVPDEETELLYQIVIRFIPEDIPLPDELDAIKEANKEKARGEVHKFIWNE
jgi:hypothetical protein